ncbi:MAG: flagellar hook-basal body complex protein FliE [Gammaproteobacteria bacterium]|nr:flagellar hook-basal body complex protein FliE [Gammaproteobacteria bacterium]
MSNMEINRVLAQMREMSVALQPAPDPAATDGAKFTEVMQQAITKVNEQQAAATEMVNNFQTGATDVSVAEVMVQMQKASLSFRAMAEVRNKLVDAYQEIMNMPI